MRNNSYCYISVFLVGVFLITEVFSHGRLIKPPGRSSAWRYGFTTPINYNDHELYCGGFMTQKNNGGKCGPCGDAWSLSPPRPNENGGKYGTGIIVEKYKRGAKIELGVELTANHMGFFEFRLCQHNRKGIPEDNACFDKNILKREDGKRHKYVVAQNENKFLLTYRLPSTITCKQCVIQWRYVAGNNWGYCKNGTGMVGCGDQEEFRACADVTITEEDGTADDTPSSAEQPEQGDEDYDYNEVDWEHVPANHSYKGHVTAISFAVVFVFIFLLILAILYFWSDVLKDFCNKKKSAWGSKIPPSLLIPSLYLGSSMKKPESVVVAPVAPPRRNRTRSCSISTDNIEVEGTKRVYTISSPTRVSINGVEVSTNPSHLDPVDLHVPNYRS